MPEKKKTKKSSTKKVAPNTSTPPPLDIGLPKSGLVSVKKVMDIVPKGKVLPPTSAKPILVSSRAVVKDPMAPPELTDAPLDLKPVKKLKPSKIVIAPLHDGVKAEDIDTVSKDDVAPKEIQEPVTDTLNVNLDTDDSTPTQSTDAPEFEPTPEVAEVAKKTDDFLNRDMDSTADDIEKSTEPKPEDLEQKRAEKRAEEAAELVESQQYFLPINTARKRRFVHFIWFLLLSGISALVILVLLDAEVLTFVAAPTDFL